MGIRGEHVLIGRGAKRGQVTLTEPLGDETLVFFDFGGEVPLVAKVNPEMHLSPGDLVDFEFDGSGFHIFDGGTGERLS